MILLYIIIDWNCIILRKYIYIPSKVFVEYGGGLLVPRVSSVRKSVLQQWYGILDMFFY
jgi:hypothetical protein